LFRTETLGGMPAKGLQSKNSSYPKAGDGPQKDEMLSTKEYRGTVNRDDPGASAARIKSACMEGRIKTKNHRLHQYEEKEYLNLL